MNIPLTFSIPVDLKDIEFTEEMEKEFTLRGTKIIRTVTKLIEVCDVLPQQDIKHLSPFTPVLVVADYEHGQLDVEILTDLTNNR